MASVYIETSIPSFYYETRRIPELQQWRKVTRTWWDRHGRHYTLFTSGYVLAELGAAPRTKAGGDAFHLAMASVHRMDFLLTWNCQHLANANKFSHIAAINKRLGLHVPVITTPYGLMPEENNEA